MKTLVIVESPSKAKTINKFLGTDYTVLSSQGHVRDISGVGKDSMGIDCAHNYAPHYTVSDDKTKIVSDLLKAVKGCDKVLLASDEDREGEAIAWHLSEVLHLDAQTTGRIVFHEITKNAILAAIANPRTIDMHLVDAQQARRVIDRLVGFELSPVLWKKISAGLSAGRVQSVAVKLLAEKEHEIQSFQSSKSYKATGDFLAPNGGLLHATLDTTFADEMVAQTFLEGCKGADFIVQSVSKKPGKRTPPCPFTTSLLQQEAARRLGYAVGKTMRIAQHLYEAGYITYMRTDSLTLSSLALSMTKTEVLKLYGEQYLQSRQYTTHTKGAQEAHEAIRPTHMDVKRIEGQREEQRLYDLIWQRTMASQMCDAAIEKTTVTIAGAPQGQFMAEGEVVTFDGFMRVYGVETTSDEDDPTTPSRLPKVQENDSLQRQTIVVSETYTRAPARYTQALLVKKLEDLGIGRPSTYATIIETILARGYVVEKVPTFTPHECTSWTLKADAITSSVRPEKSGSDSKKRLCITDTGRLVTDFLQEAVPQIMDYTFTAKSEESFDDIAAGKTPWVKVVDDFYRPFHRTIEAVPSGREAHRELGVDPRDGAPIYAKITRMGPCIQKGDGGKDKKPIFVNLPEGKSYYDITLDEALELLQVTFPYTLTEQYEGHDVTVCSGRFGPFLKYNDTFVSIPKGTDPTHIDISIAAALIAAKQHAAEPLKTFGDIKILAGKYGPYMKQGENNYKLPRGVDVESLDEAQCKDIIAHSSPTNKRRR